MKVNHHGFLVEQFQNERLILKGVAMKDKKRKPGAVMAVVTLTELT